MHCLSLTPINQLMFNLTCDKTSLTPPLLTLKCQC